MRHDAVADTPRNFDIDPLTIPIRMLGNDTIVKLSQKFQARYPVYTKREGATFRFMESARRMSALQAGFETRSHGEHREPDLGLCVLCDSVF